MCVSAYMRIVITLVFIIFRPSRHHQNERRTMSLHSFVVTSKSEKSCAGQ